MYTKKITRVFNFLLTLSMLISLLPATVNAAEFEMNIADGSIMLMETNGNKTVNMKAYTGSVTITGIHDKNYIYAYTGEHDVTIENISITRILLSSKAKLNLTLKGNNTLDATSVFLPGIYVPNGAELVITSDSTGSLNVTGASGNAGIGGMSMDTVGKITINGGIINAVGGSGAAGIGSASDGEATSVTISGGNVSAIGGNGAPGIGGTNASVCVVPESGQKVIVKENAEDDAVLGEYVTSADVTSVVSGMGSIYFETAEAGIDETQVSVTKDTDTCVVKYSITADDMAKTPMLYIAFYNSQNALDFVTVKDDVVSSGEFAVSVPSESEKCKVMLWTPQLSSLCNADSVGY